MARILRTAKVFFWRCGLVRAEETTAILKDVEEAQRKELLEKVRSENALRIIQPTAG